MTDKIYVVHTDGTETLFKPGIISETIIKETNVSEELAHKIQNRIARKINEMKNDGKGRQKNAEMPTRRSRRS